MIHLSPILFIGLLSVPLDNKTDRALYLNNPTKMDQTIPALLQVFKTTPALFPVKTIKELDQKIAGLENENIHIVTKEIKEWVSKQSRPIKENVTLFAQSFREIKNIRKVEASEEEILANRFRELRDAVKNKLNPPQTSQTNS